MRLLLSFCVLVGLSFAEEEFDISRFGDENTRNKAKDMVGDLFLNVEKNKDPQSVTKVGFMLPRNWSKETTLHQFIEAIRDYSENENGSMTDKWYDIAVETDRPLMVRAAAISEEMAKKMKQVGVVMGLLIVGRFEVEMPEFKERYGGNWKPALKEYMKKEFEKGKTVEKKEKRTKEETEEEKKKVLVELDKEFKKTPLEDVESEKSHETTTSLNLEDGPSTKSRKDLLTSLLFLGSPTETTTTTTTTVLNLQDGPSTKKSKEIQPNTLLFLASPSRTTTTTTTTTTMASTMKPKRIVFNGELRYRKFRAFS